MALTDNDRELAELQSLVSATGATVHGLPSGAAGAADPETIQTWELRRAAQREAYGQFVANQPIPIGNTIGFSPGAAVPLEHVIRFSLWEQEMVNRIATPEMARAGRAFETDEEFLAANPHVARQARRLAQAGDLHPSALDPRGAGAAIDDARKRGEQVPVSATVPGEVSPERQAAVDEAADQVAAVADDSDDGKGSPKSRKSSRSSGAKED